MDFLVNLANGFEIALGWNNIAYAALGAILGTAIGVLPGLGVPATIAILLPVTYKLPPVTAIIMLSGVYYGAYYGGSTTSILLNIPGEAASVVTCIDGYQMARQGRAGAALGVSAIGSFFAGTISIFGLALVAPELAVFAIEFGYPEYTSLILLGLTMAIYLSTGSILKGFISGVVGLLLGTVGVDPVFGQRRFTFGLLQLTEHVDFVIVAMGLFGIAEVISNLENPEQRDIFSTPLKKLLPTLEDWRRCWASVIRGSLLGFFIGVLPGGGSIISSFVSYAVEKRLSRNPESFGKGAIEGVAAPEAANNSASISSFVPLMTLGIPGNASTAMIFIALMIHGIRPGPLLIQEYPNVFWGVIASMYIGNVLLLGLNLPLIGIWVRLLKVPYKYLALIVVIMCTIGAFSVKNDIFDVSLMLVFGVIGYLMRKGGFPPAPLILAMILCPMFERSVQQTLIASGGELPAFLEHPIALMLLAIAGFMILSPVVPFLRRQLKRLPN